MNGEYRVTLRLSEADHATLQRESDHNPAASKAGAARVRFPKGTSVRVEVTHSDGTRTMLLAPGRDLSEDGIGIFHSAYMHIGVECSVTLKTVDGESVRRKGRVKRCIHLRGSVHEVGIQFDQTLDMSLFLPVIAQAQSPDYHAAGLVVTELQGLVSRQAPEAAIRVKVAEFLRAMRVA